MGRGGKELDFIDFLFDVKALQVVKLGEVALEPGKVSIDGLLQRTLVSRDQRAWHKTATYFSRVVHAIHRDVSAPDSNGQVPSRVVERKCRDWAKIKASDHDDDALPRACPQKDRRWGAGKGGTFRRGLLGVSQGEVNVVTVIDIHGRL
jgi:hypothetical protein